MTGHDRHGRIRETPCCRRLRKRKSERRDVRKLSQFGILCQWQWRQHELVFRFDQSTDDSADILLEVLRRQLVVHLK